MAKVKAWTKRNITFLQPPSHGCFGAVAWRVAYIPPKDVPKKDQEFYEDDELTVSKRQAKARMDAECSINDEAQNHYVHRKADLRALQNMRRELNKFEETCEKAMQQVEEANAES